MKSKRAYIGLIVIVAAIAFLLAKGLGNATEYFKTADEAANQFQSIGTKRFRLEGVVGEGTVCAMQNGGVRFVVEMNNKRVEVNHQGNPPELFRENIPVVVSGRFDPAISRISGVDAPVFSSDLVMIKHTAQYVQKNQSRVKDYVGKEPASGGGTTSSLATPTSDALTGAGAPNKEVPPCS